MKEAATQLLGAVTNPMDTVDPNFTVFGAEFNSKWALLLGAFWAICILIAIGFLIHGFVGIAKNKGNHPGHLRESQKEAVNAAIALGCLVGAPIIVGAIITIAG